MGDLMNQHVRFIEPGERVSFVKCEENFDPKPALGTSEDRLIERIQMSTKTIYKRIALVAVAAMGFGLLSVAPSTAASQADTLTFASSASSATLTTTAVAVLNQSFVASAAADSLTVTASLVSAPVGSTFPLVLTGAGGTNVNATGASVTGLTAQVGSLGAAYTTGFITATFTPTVAGTYVVRFVSSISGGGGTLQGTATGITWTFTVAGSAAADSTSTADMRAGTLTTGSASAISVAVGSTGVAIATIRVTPLSASVATVGSSSITASITGSGTLGIGATAGATPAVAGRSLSSLAAYGASTFFDVAVFNDGTAGTGIITITLGANTFTKTVRFTGAGASVTSTLVKPLITTGSSTSGVLTATQLDAAGNPVSTGTLYAVSGTTTVFANASATSGSAGVYTFDLIGLVAGTSTVTVQNVAAGSTATYSAAPVTVRVGTATVGNVTLSLNKASYTPGEAATLTIMLKDAAGNAVADGSPTVFLTGGVTSSRALSGGVSLPTTTTLTVGSSTGTLTYAVNVPNTTGDFTISASAGSGLTGTFSVTATVTPSAAEAAAAEAIAAAADAAAEATDAANAATDAANAAAEAADAATAAAQDAADAIAALSVQVGELVAGLTAQITAQKAAIRALTNLVIKIQKAVAAAAKKK